MIEYKIVDTELGEVMLGALDGKLAFCHFVLPSLEAVLERVAADFPGALIVPVGEHAGTEMCPDVVKFADGEQSGTVVCPEAWNVPVGEHTGTEMCPEGVFRCSGRFVVRQGEYLQMGGYVCEGHSVASCCVAGDVFFGPGGAGNIFSAGSQMRLSKGGAGGCIGGGEESFFADCPLP